MSYGVIGNTSGFGPEESRFEPLWDNKKHGELRLIGRTAILMEFGLDQTRMAS